MKIVHTKNIIVYNFCLGNKKGKKINYLIKWEIRSILYKFKYMNMKKEM